MSGTNEEPLPGFPAIGQYELVPEPGEPGYEPPEAVAETQLEGDDPEDVVDPDDDDPFGYEDEEE